MASPAGGAPQHSLHLTALVQLVKEIPGFLFGEVGPENGGASLDGERASPEGKSDSRAASAAHKVKFKLWAVPCAMCLPGCRQTRGGVTPSPERPGPSVACLRARG